MGIHVKEILKLSWMLSVFPQLTVREAPLALITKSPDPSDSSHVQLFLAHRPGCTLDTAGGSLWMFEGHREDILCQFFSLMCQIHPGEAGISVSRIVRSQIFLEYQL